MLGMLQILTYLLCVYLVFKGIEIFQIAFMSQRQERRAGLVIGVLAIILSIVGAVSFTVWVDSHAQSAASRFNPSAETRSTPVP